MSNFVQYEEKELLSQIADGDERAFAIFYHHYYEIIYPFILKHTPSREDAEEVIQQTFLRAWLYRDKLSDVIYMKSWLFKVAAREYRKHVRDSLSRRVKIARLEDCQGHLPASQSTQLNVKEIGLLVEGAIEKLSPQRRQVFYLSRKEHLSIEEIATRMGISIKTVKNTLTAALAQIREHLAAAGYAISIVMLLRL